MAKSTVLPPPTVVFEAPEGGGTYPLSDWNVGSGMFTMVVGTFSGGGLIAFTVDGSELVWGVELPAYDIRAFEVPPTATHVSFSDSYTVFYIVGN